MATATAGVDIMDMDILITARSMAIITLTIHGLIMAMAAITILIGPAIMMATGMDIMMDITAMAVIILILTRVLAVITGTGEAAQALPTALTALALLHAANNAPTRMAIT